MPLFYTRDDLALTDFFLVFPFNATNWLQREVEAALVLLTQEGNWEQTGLITPKQAAEAMSAAYQDSYYMPDPTGSIIAYALLPANIPGGCLYCDGSSYATTDYPVLFGKVGYLFGGAGANFNVPDLRGRTVVGVGQGSGLTLRNLADTVGAETHTLIVPQIPSHSHTNPPHGHSVSAAAPNLTTIGPGVPEPTAVPLPATTGFTSIVIDNTGGDGAHNNMQPSLALTYAIITGQ